MKAACGCEQWAKPECYKTGQVCWEHCRFFSSQPISITWPRWPRCSHLSLSHFLPLAGSLSVIFLFLLLNILLDFVCAVSYVLLWAVGSEAKWKGFSFSIQLILKPILMLPWILKDLLGPLLSKYDCYSTCSELVSARTSFLMVIKTNINWFHQHTCIIYTSSWSHPLAQDWNIFCKYWLSTTLMLTI